MMEALQIGTLIKDMDPINTLLIIAVLIIGSYNGWDFFNKKKVNKSTTEHLMLVWTKLFNLATKRTTILYHHILADQMRVVDTHLDEALHVFQDTFFDLKKEAGNSAGSLVYNKDVRVYRLILRIVRQEIREDLKSILRENHLTDKTEVELQSYIGQQFDLISRRVTDILNNMYDDDEVPRDVLYHANMNKSQRVYEIFSAIIRGSRDIAIRYEGELRQIDQQVEMVIYSGEVSSGCTTDGTERD